MKHKPIILHIVRSMDGGIGKHIDALAQAVRDSGEFKSALVTSNPSSGSWYDYRWALNIKDSPGLRDLLNLLKLIWIIRRFGETQMLVHGHGAKGGLYARLLKLFFGQRVCVVYTPHGGSLHRMFSPAKARLYDFVERSLCRLTDWFIFESNYSRDLFFKHVSVVAKCSINFNGVNPAEFPKQAPYCPRTPLKLASFGLYRDIKGHDVTIQACALLKKRNIPFTYEIFGEGPLRQYLQGLIARLGLHENVILKGYTTSPSSEILKSDVVLHPSRIESFGYVPLEAMALKVPVVTSFNTGLKDYMNESIGYIAYDNKPDQYYEILKALYEGTLAPSEKVERAYLWLSENMSEDSMKKRALIVYHQLLCTP